MRKTCFYTIFALATAAFAAYSPVLTADIADITEGVESIAAPGVPGRLSLFKPFVAPIATDNTLSQPTAAIGRTRTGRFLCFAHDGYFNPSEIARADTARFYENAIKWLTGREGRAKIAVIDNQPLTDLFIDSRYDAVCITFDNRDEILASDLLVFRGGKLREKDIDTAKEMFLRGKSIMTGLPGWGWRQLNAGKDLSECALNKLFVDYGLFFADGYSDAGESHTFAVLKEPVQSLNAAVAYEKLLKSVAAGKQDNLTEYCRTVELAIESLPLDEPVFMARMLKNARSDRVIPSEKSPVRRDDYLSRFALIAQARLQTSLPPNKIKASPCSFDFPGRLALGAETVSKTVSLELAMQRWHSTGLYAGAGELFDVTLPPDAPPLSLQIGTHTDKLWGLDQWKRFPQVTASIKLKGGVNTCASAFGGLIYIDVPRGYSGEIDVKIDGAFAAARYVLGQTKTADWKDIRRSPAPWAELEGENVVITVPREIVLRLDEPEALVKKWDEIFDACAELKGSPVKRAYKERITADVQISAGYMHSGYPIMTHSDQYSNLADINNLKSGNWGFFHEIGHNHQDAAWTFDGSTEVTVNIFTLYIYNRACGKGVFESGNLSPERAKQLHADFISRGADFAAWKSDPFIGLMPYAILAEEFGWEPYKAVFRKYGELSSDEAPQTDVQKMDMWVRLFSEAIRRDLTPFFTYWGWPLSDELKAELDGKYPRYDISDLRAVSL
ncbi:MAG: M60 family metallopeptidase [Phycisphaerae bacterium]|jgi:hypothetical protein